MDAQTLVASLTRRGLRLMPDRSTIFVEPASKLTDADREAIRIHKAELLRILTDPYRQIARKCEAAGKVAEKLSPASPASPPAAHAAPTPLVTPDSRHFLVASEPLALDLDSIADAIARNPRSPCLNELALARAARAAVEASRILRVLPEAVRPEALQLCADTSRTTVDNIARSKCLAAYEALDTLSERLRALRPQ